MFYGGSISEKKRMHAYADRTPYFPHDRAFALQKQKEVRMLAEGISLAVKGAEAAELGAVKPKGFGSLIRERFPPE